MVDAWGVLVGFGCVEGDEEVQAMSDRQKCECQWCGCENEAEVRSEGGDADLCADCSIYVWDEESGECPCARQPECQECGQPRLVEGDTGYRLVKCGCYEGGEHVHRVAKVDDKAWGWTGCVVSGPCDGWAHGCVVRVERCDCGAVRDVEVNGTYRAAGPWRVPEEVTQ